MKRLFKVTLVICIFPFLLLGYLGAWAYNSVLAGWQLAEAHGRFLDKWYNGE